MVLHEYRSEKDRGVHQGTSEVPYGGDCPFRRCGDFTVVRRSWIDQLDGNVEVICGISSVVYFMSKIGLSWDDAKIVSAHGRNCNLISLIRHNPKVFSILGTEDGWLYWHPGLYIMEWEM